MPIKQHERHADRSTADVARETGYATHFDTESDRRRQRDGTTNALNAVGNAETETEAAKTAAREANVADRAQARAEKRQARIRKALGVSAAVVATGVAGHFLLDSAPKAPSESKTTVTSGNAVDMTSPSTTIVTVEQPGGGINSTVDLLVANGQIEPQHTSEYKNEALAIHNHDSHVQLHEGLHIPVDHMQPTSPTTELGK